jgi:hypothetical protein
MGLFIYYVNSIRGRGLEMLTAADGGEGGLNLADVSRLT